ncbi:MAG: hypothetical protein ACRCZE_04680 [Candidatus Altimarinota bacterium]
MEIGDIMKVVKEATEENQEKLLREIRLSESDKFLKERAEIRNKLRNWWEKVFDANPTNPEQIRSEHVDLVYLRVAKWKVADNGDYAHRKVLFKENTHRNFPAEGAEFEEKCVTEATEIFARAVDILDKNYLGEWQIAIENGFKLILHMENFGSIMESKLKKLEEKIKMDDSLTKSLKEKLMFRVRDILEIKIAKLVEKRGLEMISKEHLDKIAEILNGIQKNGFSIIVILSFLSDRGKFKDKSLMEKFIRTALIPWMMHKISHITDVSMVVKMIDDLLNNELISKEILANYMKADLKDMLNKLAYNYFGRKLYFLEDAHRLKALPVNILKIHYRNLREADSTMKNGRVDEQDLEEKFEDRMRRLEGLMAIIEMLGLEPSEVVMRGLKNYI